MTFERKMLIAIFIASLLTLYSANEAHDHAHLTVNACSEYPVFDESGKPL